MRLNKYGFVRISHIETNGVGILYREITTCSLCHFEDDFWIVGGYDGGWRMEAITTVIQ
jgi:hypothetical protein